MSLLDIFTPSWKKQFDEFASTHRDALIAFLQNTYEVYPDMRIDDRVMIEEYEKNYDNVDFHHNLGELTKEEKKVIVSLKDQIVRLEKVFSKYDTPEKRVKSLYDRFRINGIFDSVFKNLLGEDYNIDDLSTDQIELVLNNYDNLVKQVSFYKEKKQKKQEKLKKKLMTRVNERKFFALLKQQMNLDKPIDIFEEDKALRDMVKNKVNALKSKYNEFNVYTLIRRILLLGFEDNSTLSKDLFVLSKENVMEDCSKTFSLATQYPMKRIYLPIYLENISYRDESLNRLIVNHDLSVLDEFVHDKLVSSTSLWIQYQNEFNIDVSGLIKSGFPEFRHPLVRTYVDVIDSFGIKKNEKLFFNHLMLREFIKESKGDTDSIAPYTTYLSSANYRNEVRAFDASNPSTINKIYSLIHNLKINVAINIFNKSPFVVVLGTSGSETPKRFNEYHFNKLIKELRKKYITVVDLSDIDKIYLPKYIVVLELFTERDTFKKTCKKILYKFPGALISYLSVYNEMSEKRYEAYQDKFH